ncbi:methyltransferase family protein [Aestuariivirga sp.]|uniref:methyltransferase family protein n=1 Tax=Aestuariivirga sp. TaxID=2650926 RepID=UPI0039E41D40
METEDRPNTIPWPPLLFGGAAAMALAIHGLAPLPFPDGRLWQVLGALMAAAAIAIDLLAFAAFRRHKTTILPHRGADHLITTGIYGWSRNPIYLGNLLLVAGAGLFFGIWWLVLAAPIALLLTWKLAVEREERHLAQRFGPSWHQYARTTSRWLGRSIS